VRRWLLHPALAVLAASAAALALLAGCGGGSGGEVARVGQLAITHSELAHWQAIAKGLGGARPAADPLGALSGDPPQGATPRQWALSYLIAQRQVAAEAAQREPEVSWSQAKHALEDLRYEASEELPYDGAIQAQRKRLKALLQSPAESQADRIQIFKAEWLSARLQLALRGEAQQSLPPSLLAAYYQAHRKSFITPEKRNVYVVESFTRQHALEARREIEAGKTIGKVVERRDEEPHVGGAKRGMTRASLTHPYEQDYFKAKLHELVGPRKAQIYYLFYVSNIQPRRLWPLREEELQIRQALIAGSQRHVLTELVQRLQRKWQARTRCAAGYLLSQCGGRL
jgi:hypothetical protein